MAVASKGIDVRQALGGHLVFRASLKDSAGAKLITGTTNLSLYEIQDDGTLKTYDFSSNTFKTTAVTTEILAMTVRKGNNNTTDLGVWSVALATLTGFAVGAVYIVVVSNTGASPPQQEREFQFGGAEGDLPVSSTGYYQVDIIKIQNATSTVGNLTTAFATATWAAMYDAVNNRFNTTVQSIVAAGLTSIAAAVWNALTATYNLANSFGAFLQARLDVVLSTRAAPGAQMDLINAPNAVALTAIGAKLEAMILDDGDATALLNAISAKVETFLINEGDATATLNAIAAAVRTNLALELSRIDVLLSSRLAAAGYIVPPTAIQNASQVRIELAVELARIDVLMSSRMATFVYTEPDNAGIATIIANQVIISNQISFVALESTSQTILAFADDFPILGALITVVKQTTDKLGTMLVIVGAGPNYQYTEEALENAPSSGGGGGSGPGADSCSFFINIGGVAVADASVWITSDEAGTIIVAGALETDSAGLVTFLLDAGLTYYLWVQKDGINSIQAQEFVATAG